MHLLTRTRRVGSRRAARGPLTVLLTLGLLAPVGVTSAAAASPTPTADPMPAAAGWVAADLAATADPGPEMLSDAILAFAASGSAGDAARDAFDALAARAGSLPSSGERVVGSTAKAILAAAALDEDPTDLDGFDAEQALRDRMVTSGEDAGQFTSFGGRQLFVQSLSILALTTTGGGAPEVAVDYLVDSACPDGSFTVTGGCGQGGDVDTTAVAIQALLATGRDADGAVSWLRAQDTTEGAFPAADPNANSSALAAQALRYAGIDDEADAAATFVEGLQKGCEAPASLRGAVATYPDADGNLRIATSQSVFARSAPLHLLDATAAAPATASLNCSDQFCPDGTGVSVVVDLTVLDPDALPEVGCATDLPAEADGFDVLEAAGFEVETRDFGWGVAICTIDELPELPEGECFDPAGGYWSYWTATPGGPWTEQQVGAGDTRPATGTIEGWAWAPQWPADAPRVSTTPAPADTTDPDPTDPDPTDPALPTPPYDRGIADACPGSYPRTFTDIAGSVHERAIRCLASAEITQGTSDPRRYAPRNAVTRGQLASFLARTYEQATGERLADGPRRFRDTAGSVHARNIDALAAAGVIAGVGDGTRFAPNATVTRGQMASFLARTLDLLDDGRVDRSFPPATDRDVFRDDDGSVHEDNIDRLAVQGVVQGRRDGTYGPQAGVTRDQLASFLARALDLAVAAGHAQPVR
jgi:hypothetical protein